MSTDELTQIILTIASLIRDSLTDHLITPSKFRLVLINHLLLPPTFFVFPGLDRLELFDFLGTQIITTPFPYSGVLILKSNSRNYFTLR
jgi:hypothetical protein